MYHNRVFRLRTCVPAQPHKLLNGESVDRPAHLKAERIFLGLQTRRGKAEHLDSWLTQFSMKDLWKQARNGLK